MLFKMKAIRAYPGISKCMRPPHTTLDFGVMSFAKALDPNSSLTCLMSCSFQAWAHHSQSNNPPPGPTYVSNATWDSYDTGMIQKGAKFLWERPTSHFRTCESD